MKLLRELSNKQMTRAEFLKAICMAAVAVFGVGSFIAALNQGRANPTDRIGAKAGRGFGSSKFGA